MVSDVVSIYKVLKDDVNKKILMIMHETDSLTYADLMEKSEICSKALPYRIKALGDLLRKNEENRYVLTEKGQLALKLLEENPEKIKKFERKKQNQIGVFIGLICVIILISTAFLYIQGYIGFLLMSHFALYASATLVVDVIVMCVDFIRSN